MRPQTAINLLTPLLGKHCFSATEARALGVRSEMLSYYQKRGIIKRLQRGLYQSTQPNLPSSFLWDDLIEAVSSINGGVICLTSALDIYELTEEIPRQHWIGKKRGTSTDRNDQQIKIVRFRNMDLGKTTIKLDGIVVPIFDRERTIIDAFRLLSRETAIKALKAAMAIKGKNRIDLRKLEDYAKQLRFNITPYLLTVMT